MFVITADQRSSRSSRDLVPDALQRIGEVADGRLVLAPQRNAGDELQVLLADPGATRDVALDLLRTGRWSVGIGAGEVDTPLPDDVRAARGAAFVHARDAIDAAKGAPGRVAVAADDREAAADVETVLRLLSDLRDRRTVQGWEVADLLAAGLSQKQASERLGITPTAVSLRAKAAALRIDEQALPSITRLLARIDDTLPSPG
jgi:hypothetical protein